MIEPTALIDRCEQICRRRERSDLLERLASTRDRWNATDIRVLVVGEFKQGKSQLVNALVGAPVGPVHDDIVTSVPLSVRYADAPKGALLWSSSAGISEEAPRREPVEISALADRLSSLGRDQEEPSADGSRVIAGEAGLPRQLLKDGLTLVDTPGIGGLGTAHGAATRAVLPSAHAVLVVTDASQELTAPEVDFIRQALAACPHVALVLSKTDLHGQWRKVMELNAKRLETAGLSLPQLAVSSQVRLAAARSRDAALNEESGFPQLVAFLRTSVMARREELAARSVRHDLGATLTALSRSLDSELRVLTSPEHLPSVIAELTAAKTQAEELKKRSSKWQQTLSDGVADLNADLDHDLRDRIRVVQAEAERIIDEGDPGHAWPEFVQWLEDATAGALADTFTWAEQNAQWLADRVAEHFEEGSAQTRPSIRVADTSSIGERVRPMGDLDTTTPGLGSKVILGMKGSYGGVLMFGILTSLVGLSLINPISLGAGILLGGRAFKEDAENRLARRRMEARSLVRKHHDDVIFQTAKILRDRLRQVQRLVRDHFAEVADELSRSIGESVKNAQLAATSNERQRSLRLAALKEDRAAVAALRSDVEKLGRRDGGG
ncbi:MAG: dynamin family protein [Ornithinimicrobium sp.]|uniref:dynamin family protein n=1 Tax=Ornithinimicrobium sp. TaxID=1977084 RepID=UPI0026E00E8F|nr:dynamin family protein [Ornithinimicrobium sp.]MDO5741199.1 dynamin family protein [Ornithinimicrobium sp.]